MNQNENTSLKQMLQSIYPNAPCVIEGIVSRAKPLQITLANDMKMTLGINSLVIPKNLTDHTITIAIEKGMLNSVTDLDGEHSHRLDTFNLSGATMSVKNALQEGEIVYLLLFNNGKKYYVLDRKG